jgi:hypothetical protein
LPVCKCGRSIFILEVRAALAAKGQPKAFAALRAAMADGDEQ